MTIYSNTFFLFQIALEVGWLIDAAYIAASDLTTSFVKNTTNNIINIASRVVSIPSFILIACHLVIC